MIDVEGLVIGDVNNEIVIYVGSKYYESYRGDGLKCT